MGYLLDTEQQDEKRTEKQAVPVMDNPQQSGKTRQEAKAFSQKQFFHTYTKQMRRQKRI